MIFNLKEFLISLSYLLDFIEVDILDSITNHGRRVGYIALKLGEKYNLSEEDRFCLLAFAIMHDIGGIENDKGLTKIELEKVKKHCFIGEKIISKFPLLNEYEDVILYHHENYDGSGFFGKSRDDIPLFSRIIAIADYFELSYSQNKSRSQIISDLKKQKNKKFSDKLVKKTLALTEHEAFWCSLKNEFIVSALKNINLEYKLDCSYQEFRDLTAIFSQVIDAKSSFTRSHSTGLSHKAKIMASYYGFDSEKTAKFRIAADLHDIGKIAISNNILNNPGRLSKEEFREIKSHAFYTRKTLEEINGFEEITEWAANHHEKNDGSGYPCGLNKESLGFPSQLMVALDIYQALREDRPYRTAMDHNQALKIMKSMAARGKIDQNIVADIESLFVTPIDSDSDAANFI